QLGSLRRKNGRLYKEKPPVFQMACRRRHVRYMCHVKPPHCPYEAQCARNAGELHADGFYDSNRMKSSKQRLATRSLERRWRGRLRAIPCFTASEEVTEVEKPRNCSKSHGRISKKIPHRNETSVRYFW